MFTDFERPAGNIFKTSVNSYLGTTFLLTCALWAAMFIWNVTTGDNPISHVIAATVEVTLPQ